MTETASQRPHRILVAIDFCPPCEVAVCAGLRTASEREGSELHLVHVIDPHHEGFSRAARLEAEDAALTYLPDRMRAYVATHARELAPSGRGHLGIHVRIGSPVEAIIQVAVDTRADLLVVGTHGRTGIKRMALGSVAESLVRTAPCPVLVTRPIDYEGMQASEAIEAPCPDCVEARQRTHGTQWWCERHQTERPETHTYSAVTPVHWSRGMADVYGAGLVSTEW